MSFKHNLCFLSLGLLAIGSLDMFFPCLTILHIATPRIASSNELYSPMLIFTHNYTLHDPIEIGSDDELAAMAIRGVGTPQDPFILEGWNITTLDVHGIEISYTTKYFILQNCWINATNVGIFLSSIHNGTGVVRNNFCQTQWGTAGIIIDSVSSALVVNNSCINNCWGIHLDSSPSSVIVNNICNKNGVGIFVISSPSIQLWHNICNSNELEGISIDCSAFAYLTNNSCNYNIINGLSVGNCPSSVVKQNILTYQQTGHGIVIQFSMKCLVTENTLQQNTEDGLHLWNSSMNTIRWNAFHDNQRYGIGVFPRVSSPHSVGRSNNNLIHHNNFIATGGLEASSHAFDDGFNSRYGWNYWSDYNGTGVYSIPGSANAFDPHPLSSYADFGATIPLEADLIAPTFVNVTHSLVSLNSSYHSVISTSISDGSGVDRVILHYSMQDHDLSGTVNMNLTFDNSYQAILGPLPYGITYIHYSLLAIDSSEFQNKAYFEGTHDIKIWISTNSTTIPSIPSISPSTRPPISWFLILILGTYLGLLGWQNKTKNL